MERVRTVTSGRMIPDYLIYDELKRRRQEQESDQRVQLELPLYTPRAPISEPPGPDEAGDERSEYDDAPSERGVFIIDINDLIDEDDELDD